MIYASDYEPIVLLECSMDSKPSAWKAIECDIELRNGQDALKLKKYADTKGSMDASPLLRTKVKGKVQNRV